MARPLDAKSSELQGEIDRLARQLGVRPLPVGLLTNDGLNVFVADDGVYHYTFYERGKVGYDHAGSLNDVLYFYCRDIVIDRFAHIADRAERFQHEYEVLGRFDPVWAKRNVRETAAMFRNGQPEDISLLPDIGEPL
ncbi:hypothetical protein ACXDF8_21940 [Mycolicibacterium sp. CBM1]